MAQETYKIVVSDITKSYKMYNAPMDRLKEALSVTRKIHHTEFNALSHVSFHVAPGEILGIMGRNGAGKSTLLKIISSLLSPTSGSVKISGRISSLLELGTGFNMEYNGIENIYFYATLMGLTKVQIDERLDKIIQFAEIGDYVHQPVKTYSSGMFARLAFSCAINVDPDILIVDEILSVGDLRFQAKCFNKFKEFKNEGVTILYVGHDVGLMRTFCDTALWLNDGRIMEMGDPYYVSAKYLEFMYLEDSIEFTAYKKHSSGEAETSEDTPPELFPEPEPTDAPKIAQGSIFPNSIAHWGREVGLITAVKLLDEQQKEQNHFTPFETMQIVIEFKDSPELDYDQLSVAFSIKNKEGTDLIVKTTYDEEMEILRAGRHKVTFTLQSRLATGEYYIVIALEDRKHAAITYYEYVEGVKYFKVYTDKKIFGVVDADVAVQIV